MELVSEDMLKKQARLAPMFGKQAFGKLGMKEWILIVVPI